MKDQFKLDIEAKSENLEVIWDFITDSMKKFGLNDRKIFDIQMAVDEACTNIIEHGYREETNNIRIICIKKDKKIIVIIKDRGKPFDPTSVQPPNLNTSLEEREMGGLGVYFMKKLMDEVIYDSKDGENILTMIKFI